jgi:hypothetical protein
MPTARENLIRECRELGIDNPEGHADRLLKRNAEARSEKEKPMAEKGLAAAFWGGLLIEERMNLDELFAARHPLAEDCTSVEAFALRRALTLLRDWAAAEYEKLHPPVE